MAKRIIVFIILKLKIQIIMAEDRKQKINFTAIDDRNPPRHGYAQTLLKLCPFMFDNISTNHPSSGPVFSFHSNFSAISHSRVKCCLCLHFTPAILLFLHFDVGCLYLHVPTSTKLVLGYTCLTVTPYTAEHRRFCEHPLRFCSNFALVECRYSRETNICILNICKIKYFLVMWVKRLPRYDLLNHRGPLRYTPLSRL